MLAHRSTILNTRRGLNASSLHSFLLLSVFLVLLVGLAGCGNEEKSEGVIPDGDILASVDGVNITSRDYKEGLASLMSNQLPLDDNGAQWDMASEAGKAAYLDILINKQVLVNKAIKSGYDKEADVLSARKKHLNGSANQMLWTDIVEKPTENISEEELAALYEKLGNQRVCQFLITNYEKDALAAREMAQKGTDWEDIVARYHDGLMPPSGLRPISVIYGYRDAFFDEAVFAVEVGEITAPIYTGTGYWVLKIISETEGEKPDLETNKPTILDIVHRRKVEKVREAFRSEVQQSHKLKINEDALVIAYNGLDPDEMGRDPRTGRAKPVSEMKTLQISTKNMDMLFYSYVVDGEKVEATLGEYKEHFDRMGGFQRPLYAGLIGGMRNKVTMQLERHMMADEARSRGYYEHPEVLRVVDGHIHDMITGRLLGQAVTYDKDVDPELIASYFAEHKSDLHIAESRDGLLVVCRDEAVARKAVAMLGKGSSWEAIVNKYGTDQGNKSQGGKIVVNSHDARPRALALFSLAKKSDISEPFLLADGRFGVVSLVTIHEGHPAALEEVSYKIGSTIRNEREIEAMNAFIASLRSKADIQIFEEKIQGLPSYEEAINSETPQNVVSGS